jgi:hypothetical protein
MSFVCAFVLLRKVSLLMAKETPPLLLSRELLLAPIVTT